MNESNWNICVNNNNHSLTLGMGTSRKIRLKPSQARSCLRSSQAKPACKPSFPSKTKPWPKKLALQERKDDPTSRKSPQRREKTHFLSDNWSLRNILESSGKEKVPDRYLSLEAGLQAWACKLKTQAQAKPSRGPAGLACKLFKPSQACAHPYRRVL